MWNPTHNMQARIKFCFLLHPDTPGKPTEWIPWVRFYQWQIVLGWHSDLTGLQLVPPGIQLTLMDHLILSTELRDVLILQSWSLQAAAGYEGAWHHLYAAFIHLYRRLRATQGSTQRSGSKAAVLRQRMPSAAESPGRVLEYNKHIMILLTHKIPASSDSWARLLVFNSRLGFIPQYCNLILLYFQYALSALRRISFLYSYTIQLLKFLCEWVCVNAPFISCWGLSDVLVCREM